MVTTTKEMKIDVDDPSQVTRVRRINVKPLPEDKREGDAAWPKRLREELPALLHECRAAYERLMIGRKGKNLPQSEACLAALAGGTDAINDDFSYLDDRLEFTRDSKDYVFCEVINELMNQARYGYARYGKENARDWMIKRGASNKGGPKRKGIRVWEGVRLKQTPK
jgi:hypothetical protein